MNLNASVEFPVVVVYHINVSLLSGGHYIFLPHPTTFTIYCLERSLNYWLSVYAMSSLLAIHFYLLPFEVFLVFDLQNHPNAAYLDVQHSYS